MLKKIAVIEILAMYAVLMSFTPPEWAMNSTIYEANIRQYTKEGSFSAFCQHLDRLQEMGIGIIWLMPVHPIGIEKRKGTLGSYYSVADYYGINPEFGDKEDFRNLVNEIHKRSMYVLIDWVANHSSWDNVWTKTNPDFYKKDAHGKFYPPVKDWADVIQLDYSNYKMRQAMTDAMVYWVKEFDIDGFRCDVAEMVPLDFWISARKEIEEIKPVFMLAECENPHYHAAFDMTYSWSALKLFKKLNTESSSVLEIDSWLMRERKKFQPEDYRMLFLTNHDENSWHKSMPEQFPESYRALTVLTYALPGMPLIYSGQEALNGKRLKFFEKDEIIWQKTEMDTLYYHLNKLVKTQPAMLMSDNVKMRRLANSNPEYIYSISRQMDRREILFLINLSSMKQEFTVEAEGTYTEELSLDVYDLEKETKLKLPAWEFLILLKDY